MKVQAGDKVFAMIVEIRMDQTIKVLLPASLVPDGSRVSKRTGESEYVLRHSLTVYPEDALRKKGTEKISLRGLFLLGETGNITQVSDSTLLHWIVEASELVEHLQEGWRNEQ